MARIDDQLVKTSILNPQQEIEQFLYHEAALLEERKFKDWLALFTNDIRYWMPVLFTLERGAREIADDREMAFYDDTKETLTLRVKRLYTEFAHTEDPPSKTVRFISNVRVSPSRKGNDVRVTSNFLVFRTKHENQPEVFAGHREDILQKVGRQWKIRDRKIILGQDVLPSQMLSIFL